MSIIAVVGATGTGKSQLAVDLALRFSGEVINGDAMQMYEGLPIITNKISLAERKGVPHHLLGCVKPTEEPWTVGVFVEKALAVIRDIHARGKLPILVGGTHYYLQSLLMKDVLAEAVNGDGNKDQEKADIAASPESDDFPILQGSTENMLAKLREVDPVMANRWHPGDRRKIRRSLEIWLKTGQRASDVYADQARRRALPSVVVQEKPLLEADAVIASQNNSPRNNLRFPTLLLWTHSTRDILRHRLDNRVDSMIAAGLLDEVIELSAKAQEQTDAGAAVDSTRGIWVSIGYKEFVPYLKALPKAEAVTGIGNDSSGLSPSSIKLGADSIEQTKAATRQYAKRQVRWLRIKLYEALQASQMTDKLLVLDTSDPSMWEQAILPRATEYVKGFLGGHDIVQTQNDALIELNLGGHDDDNDHGNDREGKTPFTQQTCEICGVTAVTPKDWGQHTNSRRHKNAIRSNRRRELEMETTEEIAA